MLPHGGMHLATQSMGWSMPERYHGAALLRVRSHINPCPVWQGRRGLSGCAECTMLVRWDSSIYWSEKAFIFQPPCPSLLPFTRLPSRHRKPAVADSPSIRLTDALHREPLTPGSENRPLKPRTRVLHIRGETGLGSAFPSRVLRR